MYALLDEDQQSLKDAVTSVAGTVGLVNPSDLGERTPDQAWKALAQMGLLELRRREDGEPPASGVEVMVTCEELGAHLVPGAYLPAAILTTELLTIGGAPETWLDEAVASPTYAIGLRPDLVDIASVDCHDVVVWGGEQVQHVLLLATVDGVTRLARAAITEPLPENGSVDLTQGLWSITIPPAEILDSPISAGDLDGWRSLALASICADTVGLMRAALRGAVDYSKDRIAYGVPIGSFQAIQHLAAETLVSIEGAYAATSYAAWCVDADPDARLLAARTAKAYTASIARTATENVMQIYGGVGQTWEHIAHFYTRRALLNTHLLGDATNHLERIGQQQMETD